MSQFCQVACNLANRIERELVENGVERLLLNPRLKYSDFSATLISEAFLRSFTRRERGPGDRFESRESPGF